MCWGTHHHHLRITSCFLYGVGRAMAFRHSSLFSVVISSIPRYSISSSMHLLQLFFGLPTGLLPGTSILIALPTALSSPLLFTWPNHLNLLYYQRVEGYNITLSVIGGRLSKISVRGEDTSNLPYLLSITP